MSIVIVSDLAVPTDSLQVILVPLRPRLTEPTIIDDVSGVLLSSDLLAKLITDELIVLVG